MGTSKSHLIHKSLGYAKLLLLILCWLAVVLVIYAFSLNLIADAKLILSDEGRRLTLERIEQAVLMCRAIEGSYPAELGYLKNKYGLNIDETLYTISYELSDGAKPPSVTVRNAAGS